ncbi:hypothetical protein Q2T40_17725 [Winogradskyella maritima]|uniref:Oxygen tolerance protein BatD n=1 Tax=Winogradskyella maritima TaxID=1517766 RepID=A0ABV8AG27_9FLAO|nr:hypothetical protein [Winogradskyella maritima]
MIFELRHMNVQKRTNLGVFLPLFLILTSSFSFSQVTTEVDTTKIRIGEQINFKIKVETDSTNLVIFPEGQTFTPLEVVEISEIDTLKKDAKFQLLRNYALTQFDSGSYYIPKQKLLIGDTVFMTDSLKVYVNTVEVDTTKQGLYDIKPIIEVEKSSSKWWLYLLLILLGLGLVAFLIWWFIWRKKPLTEEETIALLPPYDRAKLALEKLDEKAYLEKDDIKNYYVELTLILRKYLDEKVYDRALESTTDELIARLKLLQDANELELDDSTISSFEKILKRADLVKFAKSVPDKTLAEMDKDTISKEIDAVRAQLPEPSEEEKFMDLKYKEAVEKRKKTRKILLTIGIAFFVLMATTVGLGIKYGFAYVKDTIIGHESKELLEGDWVDSAYGFPPVYISTPRVLKRIQVDLPEEQKANMTMTTFNYGTMLDIFSVTVNTTTLKRPQNQTGSDEELEENAIDLLKVSEGALQGFEQQGAQDITVKRETVETPNGAEGLKTFGEFKVTIPNTDKRISAKYDMLIFKNKNVLQQIIITYPEDDDYADQMVERIENSIELIKRTDSEEEEDVQ